MEKLSNLEFKKKFDSVAKRYEKISNPYTINRRSELFRVDSSKLILEVGSATGIISEQIDKSIICTDISFEMCKEAVRKKRANVICCDAEKLPIRNNSIDGILSTEMIYYLNNPEDFLKNSYNLGNFHQISIDFGIFRLKKIEAVFLAEKNNFFSGTWNFFVSNIDFLNS